MGRGRENRSPEKATKENVIYLLESKFELVSSDIKKKIEQINDVSILKGLLKRLLTVSSIEEFEESLNKAKMLS